MMLLDGSSFDAAGQTDAQDRLAFLVVAGLGLLWEDFIAPLMKGQDPS